MILDYIDEQVVGGGIITAQVANFPFPASGVIDSDPEPGGGVLVVADAVGDQAITSVQVLDSLDGVTYRAHQAAATVVTRPWWKVRLTNGATAQTDSEFNVATSS